MTVPRNPAQRPDAVNRSGRRGRRIWFVAAICGTVLLPVALHASQSNRNTGELAIETLPADMPGFLRRPEAVIDVGAFASEPDRLRGAGPAYDAATTEDHYFQLDAAGRTRTGVLLEDLPPTREVYAKLVHAKGLGMAKEGAVYYTVVEAFERLRQDFAYWRVTHAATKRWTNPAERTWAERALLRREWLIERDIGMLAHFTQDAAAPLHISISNDSWQGDPARKFTARPFRRYIEGPFVKLFVTRQAVKDAMPAPAICTAPITTCVGAIMRSSLAYVEPAYDVATRGGFDLDGRQASAFAAQLSGASTAPGSVPVLPEPSPSEKRAVVAGVALMARQGARSATYTRDLVVKAWRESLDRTINYPPMVLKVRDVEDGAIPTFAHLHGWD